MGTCARKNPETADTSLVRALQTRLWTARLKAESFRCGPRYYTGTSGKDPAYALHVLHPRARWMQVLPQKWFTGSRSDVGCEWITRAARDPETLRIVGDCIRIGKFLLQDDGCSLDRWIDKAD